MGSDVSPEQRRAVANRAYHVCEYCLVHEDDNYFSCEVDHIISIKHDGRTELTNLAYACFRCNRHKGNGYWFDGPQYWSFHSILQCAN